MKAGTLSQVEKIIAHAASDLDVEILVDYSASFMRDTAVLKIRVPGSSRVTTTTLEADRDTVAYIDEKPYADAFRRDINRAVKITKAKA